jgi:hypothetical protein
MTHPQKFMKLSAALNWVAAHTSQTDVARCRPKLREKYKMMGFFLPEASASNHGQFAKFNRESSDSWLKQQAIVLRMESAVLEGKFNTYARDPKTGALFYVDPRDWKDSAYREESFRGGTFRASACERIEQYRDWDALADIESLERWLAAEKCRRPAADEGTCRAWLLEAMLASPNRRIKAKREWRTEATRLFGVTVRAFNRAWRSAIEASGSTWNRPGAFHKSSH